MKDTDHEIFFLVTYRGETHAVKTFTHEYRNLMALLYDRFYFEDFGDCKGIGRCGTCHVKIDNGNPDVFAMERNERTTLSRLGNVSIESRLSCQILVTKAIDQLHFTITEEGSEG